MAVETAKAVRQKVLTLDAAVHSKAKQIAAWRGVSLGEYLNQVVGSAVDRDYKAFLRDAVKDAG